MTRTKSKKKKSSPKNSRGTNDKKAKLSDINQNNKRIDETQKQTLPQSKPNDRSIQSDKSQE